MQRIEGFELSNITIGRGTPFVLIAGPCVIESKEHAIMMAYELKQIADSLGLAYIFKSSYDKANRTSIESFRGPGLTEGLSILAEIKEKVGCPVLSDVHDVGQAKQAKSVLDVIQIPAFLCRQTDLVLAVADTGAVVNIKKGQFISPYEVPSMVQKALSTGNKRVMVTERGYSFGYRNLVVDYRSLVMIRDICPVVFDATHSVQLPGAGKGVSSGERRFVPYLASAAAAVGIDALFMEVHDNPQLAKSDGPNMIPLKQISEILKKIIKIDHITKGY